LVIEEIAESEESLGTYELSSRCLILLLYYSPLHSFAGILFQSEGRSTWISLGVLSTDQNFQPKVAIVVPTFNEARLIEDKLDNIYGQDYPKGRLEIIVFDSASTIAKHLGTYDKYVA